MIYMYPCQLSPDEDGGLVVGIPDVPEAITSGGDRAEALAMAEDTLLRPWPGMSTRSGISPFRAKCLTVRCWCPYPPWSLENLLCIRP